MNEVRVKLPSISCLFVISLLLMIACSSRDQSDATPSASPTSAPAPASTISTPGSTTDQWLGKWIGPEGTFLELSKQGEQYSVMIQSLDGPATYQGLSTGDHIEFQRSGHRESIHAGNGQETGMKWLLDKKTCLIVKIGEGYCRN